MHPNFHSVERAVWFISKGSEQFYKNSLNKGRAMETPLDCQNDRISDKTRAELEVYDLLLLLSISLDS